MLMVLAYAARKQVHEARSLLLVVLSQASAEGYLRLFLDEGAALATLLRFLTPYLREPSLLAYLQTMLQAFAQERQQPSAVLAATPLVEALSPQEQRVLRLLAAGRSNREIANELVVSVNTVRTQVQSIYRKLDVNNRVAAGATARHLHLL
jgi:LuxR family maltose regulon positive regulatory protein